MFCVTSGEVRSAEEVTELAAAPTLLQPTVGVCQFYFSEAAAVQLMLLFLVKMCTLSSSEVAR